MDIPQLKLLAARVRGLLQQSSSLVGHSQALDLIAALPGLRNWPEVMAFPERVAACTLDIRSASRLAYRLNKKFSLELEGKELLESLSGAERSSPRSVPQVWPSGPLPGVYVTTSAAAIGALLARYEEATDGELVYTERAASGWQGSIDLGEYGLWSSGLHRLPSGTLLVVGPLEFDQAMWEDSCKRLEMACLHALNSEHRVAVLVDTPTPDHLCEDVALMIRAMQDRDVELNAALRGVVTEEGELSDRRPFARRHPKLKATKVEADVEAIPRTLLEPLRRELAMRTRGMVLFGASEITVNTAYDQLSAALVLTEHAGPAARVMSRHRSTPAKDWMVPEPIKRLPFLPSIESAYAQGYRRILIDPLCSQGNVWLDYEDVLFMGATYGHAVVDVALNLVARASQKELESLQRIVAVLGLLKVTGTRGTAIASDLFLRGDTVVPMGTDWSGFEEFLKLHRCVRWEDELSGLLDTGTITEADLRKASSRNTHVTEFLTQRRGMKKAS